MRQEDLQNPTQSIMFRMSSADMGLEPTSRQQSRRALLPPGGEIVYGVGSRLQNPGRFFLDWLVDLRACGPTARRLFLGHIAQQYRFSSLGLLWAFAPSILTALVLIGGQRAHVVGQGGGVTAAFYGVFGLGLAQTFLEALNATRRVFASHQQLLRRQNVPLDGLIVAGLLDVAFNMVVRLIVIVTVFFVFSVPPAVATLPLAFLGFVGVAVLGAGLGLLVAPLNSLKRDIDNLFGILPWILFAVTPVFVPLSTESRFGQICQWNPLTRLFDGIRAAAYGGDGDPSAVFRGLILGLVIMFVGWMFCRIARPHIVERMLG